MNYPTIDRKVKAGFVSRAARLREERKHAPVPEWFKVAHAAAVEKKGVSPAEVWDECGLLVPVRTYSRPLVESCGVSEAITMQLAIVGKSNADALRQVATRLASGQLMAMDLLNNLTPEHRRAVLIHALRDMGGRTVRRAVWQRSAFGREWLARPWWAWALALVPRRLRLMLMAGCGREY